MNHMTSHLLEAIVLNTRRLPMYARLTRGKSIKISLLLILSEASSLITSVIMDAAAKYWQKRGVPVFVHEFIPMKETPAFKKSFGFAFEPLRVVPKVAIPKSQITRLLSEKKYGALSAEIEDFLVHLAEYPHVFCMTRHTLESFLRCCNLTPMHMRKAAELNVKSPERFCFAVLKSHLFALDFCLFLDRLAFSIQNSGVPIVAQDVPSIAPMPRSYDSVSVKRSF